MWVHVQTVGWSNPAVDPLIEQYVSVFFVEGALSGLFKVKPKGKQPFSGAPCKKDTPICLNKQTMPGSHNTGRTMWLELVMVTWSDPAVHPPPQAKGMRLSRAAILLGTPLFSPKGGGGVFSKQT